MHDIVIRGGTIIDGTGKAALHRRCGDHGRPDRRGRRQAGPGKREIDADGLLVTPGWVDVHTHYDGQAMWDPLLAPSCWHGVTTVMFGNCGVGFAPVKKEHRGALMDLMEGVEEIPNPVLAAGLSWEWESFPQYMDELERRPRAIDIARADRASAAARLCHGRPRDAPRAGDARRHCRDARPDHRGAALPARSASPRRAPTSHKTPDGDLVPSRDADDHELLGIGSALGVTGTGAFGMN